MKTRNTVNIKIEIPDSELLTLVYLNGTTTAEKKQLAYSHAEMQDLTSHAKLTRVTGQPITVEFIGVDSAEQARRAKAKESF